MDTNQSKPSQNRHNHVKKIENLVSRGIIKANEVQYLTIRHDDSCALLGNRGLCDCDPDVETWEHLKANQRKRPIMFIPATGQYKTE